MPLQRYLLVEGKLDANGIGIPVSDPRSGLLRTGATARFLGWKPKAIPPKDADFLIEHFEPVSQVVLDHQDTRDAIKKGELTMHGECVAKSFEEASKRLLEALAAISRPQPRMTTGQVTTKDAKKGGDA